MFIKFVKFCFICLITFIVLKLKSNLTPRLLESLILTRNSNEG